MSEYKLSEYKLNAILLQANISLARARRYELRIQAKCYRERLGNVRDGFGRALEEQELLKSEIAIHNSHIRIAQECLDAYNELVYSMEAK